MTGLGLVAAGSLLSAYPLVRGLTPPGTPVIVQVATAVGVSAVAQAVWMFWLALQGPGSLARMHLAWLHAGLLVVGVGLLRFRPRPAAAVPATSSRPPWLPAADALWIGLGLAALMVAARLIFIEWDAIALWGLKAQRLFRVGGFDSALYPEDVHDVYQSYPPLVPFLYCAAYLWSGRVDEGAALLASAGMGMAALAAARGLGERLGPRGAGGLVAAALALTPLVVSHLVSGYAELPFLLYVLLAGYWVVHVAQAPGWGSVGLAAACLAGAAWCKPAGILFPALAAGGGLAAWLLRREGGGRILAAACLAGGLASPWYLRTIVMFGVPVPNQWWSALASHDPVGLLPFLLYRDLLGWPTAVAATVGECRALWLLVRGGRETAAGRVLAAGLLAYLAVWWWKLSYDPRLFLPALPLALTLGVSWGLTILRGPRLRAAAAGVWLVTVAAGWPATAWGALLARAATRSGNPACAQRELLDAGVDVARYLKMEAGRGPVDLVTHDGRLTAFLDGMPGIRVAAGLAYRLEHVRGATHLSLGPWTDWAASVHHLDFPRTELGRAVQDRHRFQPLLVADGFRLYRIRPLPGVRRPMPF